MVVKENNNKIAVSVVQSHFRITLPDKVREVLNVVDDGMDVLGYYITEKGVELRKLLEENERSESNK